jgi:hypothetical protein
MALPELAADGAAIVIRGGFSPKRMTPKWLADQGLISVQDVEDVEYDILVPDVAVYTAGWVRCQLQSESMELTCLDPADFERLRDLAVGILRSLPDLKVSLLGINRVVHFQVSDWKKWHHVGDTLANNDVWNGVLSFPGMRSLTIWGQRSGKYYGHTQVQVEPSSRYPRAIYVACNDHYDLTLIESWPASRDEAIESGRVEDSSASSEKVDVAVSALTDDWGASMKRAHSLIANVAKQVD